MNALPRPALRILLIASLILALSLGVRHGFGLFLDPMSRSMDWGREVFAFAIALQNLLWGLVQPLTGALADRYGANRVVVGGGLLYAAGLALMAVADSPAGLNLSAGLLIGLGLSGTSFSILLSAVGKAAPPAQRSLVMGIAAAAGSFGQFAMLPTSLGLLQGLGWSHALLALALLIAVLIPLGLGMGRPGQAVESSGQAHLAFGPALRQAAGHGGFQLLALGFFVCGFQVVFIGIHLPTYLLDQGIGGEVATTVLALVGLFNIVGTYLAGWLGGRYSKPRLLAGLYLLRSLVILVFFLTPTSAASAYVFGIAMGLLWLSTVPLTNGCVASFFGIGNLSMLTGLAFLLHQVGSFFGGWLGGRIYDQTGSYDLVWQISIALGLVAAALNWPIRERAAAAPAPNHGTAA